jgi:AcrR family transcriptional regulator
MTEQKKNEMRLALQEAAIVIIAECGLEQVTTKELTLRANTSNEVYIYRLFRDKTDLLVTTFETLDRELVESISTHLDIMRDESLTMDVRCFRIFCGVWRYILSNRQRCSAFMQYYYSPLFPRYSGEAHRELYANVLQRFGRVFKPDVDVWRMLNYVLDVMLTMSIRVFRGEIEASPEFERKVFEWIFRALRPYLIWDD